VDEQQPIQEETLHKHLGVVLSCDGIWHDHLEYIKSKAWTRTNVMKKLKFKLDRKSLQIIYFTFIRPILGYANVVWNNCTQYEIDELEKIQNEAVRIVTGATKLVSVKKKPSCRLVGKNINFFYFTKCKIICPLIIYLP
ncbi:MAG: hypothetical protein AB2693_17295, partial [Candidatus Thiodiazotropha sp.]